MTDHVNYYKNAEREYKEYIELWIHEVKTPIAARIAPPGKNEPYFAALSFRGSNLNSMPQPAAQLLAEIKPIASTEGEGCEVRLIFPRGSYAEVI